ncbi:TetR/AcrR family transcriptional regulator [Solirubrobacter sp. CPCC 204708]|uniref:TetR/AcrR family transcriptional regulator n=1 Tax=Solirubrobacter deserti TaxID=2282478 RepID=A0ABT4REG1_9ACTN|nr:TetR/AcrR family transcriptional regulator [Solirubrobacter deserti]MBE2316138.1 TetR/AcrR family transcriptional regulator [Solirubrobacter deserti]MDA0136888.1 TetR/AcrR family transcriptional regulator [Solirubrobacter deserti]
MRADAARNRSKLLSAAAEEFALRGSEASLEAVAKRAGVGIGTLYRHFPTRDELVAAAYEAEVEDLRATADALLAEHPPDVALERWMDRFIDYTATKRGMAAALDADFKAVQSGKIRGAVETLRAAGVEAGVLRADVDADDVRAMMGAVWQITDPERARRMLRVLMDGLRVVQSEDASLN